MEYLWIVMIVIIYVIWSISAIKDIFYYIKRYRLDKLDFDFELLEGSTYAWFVVTIAALFIWSFVSWISR